MVKPPVTAILCWSLLLHSIVGPPLTADAGIRSRPWARCLRAFAARRCAVHPRPVRVCTTQTELPPAKEPQWKPLFDGQSLDGWESTNFGGEGDVHVDDGQIILEMGYPLTGITYKRSVPSTNYEVQLEAMRQEGIDFFCGLTFPVGQSHCSLIVSGWAGAVVGLSSIDGRDASDNETTRFMNFKDQQWYRIRVRVTPQRIQAWIDDQPIVDQDIVGRRISTRVEVDLSKPLGISAYETRAALRGIQIRELPAPSSQRSLTDGAQVR